jgi:hypothetical protein
VATKQAGSSDRVGLGAVGWLAVAAALAIALGLTVLRARSDSPPGMGPVPLLGFFVAFAGPGLVAAVGVARRRPGLLGSAALVLILLSPLSMGGATLPFLIPAVVLVYVAPRLSPTQPQGFRSRLAAVVAFFLLAAAPIALFSTTEVVCWDDYGGGNVVTRVLPEMPNEASFTAPFGSGCSSGSISSLGGSLAMLAVAGALVVAGRR